MKRILEILLYIVLISILVINITSIFNIKLFGYQIFTVASGSMEPTITIGDIILIKEQKEYKIDDIITYKTKENEYITHRIIAIENEKVITKGDANNAIDEKFKREDIIGKYICKFSLFRKITKIHIIIVVIIVVISRIILKSLKKGKH